MLLSKGEISPLLANIYLHYVLDLWAHHGRKQQAGGDVIVVRYADDSVLGFQSEKTAQRFLQDMQERFAKFGLALHSDKTTADRVWSIRRKQPSKSGAGSPGDVRLSRVHALLRIVLGLRELKNIPCLIEHVRLIDVGFHVDCFLNVQSADRFKVIRHSKTSVQQRNVLAPGECKEIHVPQMVVRIDDFHDFTCSWS